MAFISSTSRGFSPAACRMRATVSWTYFWQWFPWKLYVQKCPIWRPCKISLSFIHPLNSSSRNKVWAGFSLCNCRLRKNWWLSRAATSGCMSPPFCFSCQVLWRWSGARASQHWGGWAEILSYKLPSCVASTQGRYRKIVFGQSDSMIDINR